MDPEHASSCSRSATCSAEIASEATALEAASWLSDINVTEFRIMMAQARAAIREITTKFENLDEDARIRLGHSPIHSIKSRLKTPESLKEKLARNGFDVTLESIRANIFDLAGVRVVCKYLQDIATVERELLNQTDVRLLQRKDYITHPKESGYRSLHLVVSVPVFLNGGHQDVAVEVQLRTIAMDFWSSLEHSLRYKNQWVLDTNTPALTEIRARLLAAANRISALDEDMQDIRNNIAHLMQSQGIDWDC